MPAPSTSPVPQAGRLRSSLTMPLTPDAAAGGRTQSRAPPRPSSDQLRLSSEAAIPVVLRFRPLVSRP